MLFPFWFLLPPAPEPKRGPHLEGVFGTTQEGAIAGSLLPLLADHLADWLAAPALDAKVILTPPCVFH